MSYHEWQRVELFHNGEWYQAHVAAVDEESADGKRCYRIKFEENNPTGSSSMQTIRYTTILIPIEDADTLLRPWRSEATKKTVGGGGADARFKNSVNIRF